MQDNEKKGAKTKVAPDQDPLWARTLSRRQALWTVGGLTVGALATACSSSKSSTGNADGQNNTTGDGLDSTADTSAPDLAGGLDLSGGSDLVSEDDLSGVADILGSEDLVSVDLANPDSVASCTVYPQQTAGPFYLDLNMLRQDITEGKPGTPLKLTMQVSGSKDCAPLTSIAVDLWACDADGRYSGFPGQVGNVDTSGQTWLRGTQVTDGQGRVTFDLIYPGWYPGRTTHIHFRIHTSSTSEAISQLYFPDETTSAVYKTAPYDTRGQKDTANSADGIYLANTPTLLQLTASGNGYTSSVSVIVKN